MTALATLVLTGIDLVEEIHRRRTNKPFKPTHRTMMAEATLTDFREALASAIREGRDVTPEETRFWLDRINQDRATLREVASRSETPDVEDSGEYADPT